MYTPRLPLLLADSTGARLCTSLGIDYAPVIWPGTSADHLNGRNNPADLDYFPRFNGTFYETQANDVISLDPMFIYTAMFDEVNEGKSHSIPPSPKTRTTYSQLVAQVLVLMLVSKSTSSRQTKYSWVSTTTFQTLTTTSSLADS